MKEGLWLAALLAALLICGHGRAETLLAMSDMHLTVNDQAFAPVLSAVQRAAGRGETLILLGDNTNNGWPEEHRKLAAFLRETEKETGCEVYVLPGNHDLSGRTNRAAFAQVYAEFGLNEAVSRHGDSLSYAVRTRGGTALVMLDLNCYDALDRADTNGWVTESLLSWLGDTLDQLGGWNTVVCAHYPIYPLETETLAERQQLLRLLREKDVRLFLCGHRHVHDTVLADGLRQVTVGVPEAFPCCLGQVTETERGFSYTLRPLFEESDPWLAQKKADSRELAVRMAKGTLLNTALQDDGPAQDWFVEAFTAYTEGKLLQKREALLEDENCLKWRQVNTRYLVRDWILSVLERTRESIREIDIS